MILACITIYTYSIRCMNFEVRFVPQQTQMRCSSHNRYRLGEFAHTTLILNKLV